MGSRLVEGKLPLALLDTERHRVDLRLNPFVQRKAPLEMLSWSEDSKTVLFVQAGEAFAYDVATHRFRRLATAAGFLVLVPSENGGYAVVTATATEELVFHVYDRGGALVGSFPAGIVGRESREWLISDAILGRIRSSRHRRFCAFWLYDSEFARLYVTDLREMKSTCAYRTKHLGNKLVGHRFRWSSSRSYIVSSLPKFRRSHIRPASSVLITDAENGRTREVEFSTKEIPPPIRFHSWSPDGRRFLMSDWKCRHSILAIDAENGGKTPVPLAKTNRWPRFDADGQVVFHKRGPMD